MGLGDLTTATRPLYGELKNPARALVRDLLQLEHLTAVALRHDDKTDHWWVDLRLKWPTEITQTDFFERVRNFPKAKTSSLLP